MSHVTTSKHHNGLTRVDMEDYYDDVEIDSLFQWVDRIPLSRPKTNMAKDFSDGVLCAEIIKHYFPRDVDLHNYTPAHSTKQKLENWHQLNRKVLRKFDLDLSADVMRALANHKPPSVIEKVLMLLRLQIDNRLEKTGRDLTWRKRELYYIDPLSITLPLSDTKQEEDNTPHGVKSPRGQGAGESSSRTLSPSRQTKSEPAANSPRKYNRGEIPHSHPDRTTEGKPGKFNASINGIDALAFDYPAFFGHHSLPYSERSYGGDRSNFALVPRSFLPPVSDNIARALYEEKEMECEAKAETIQILTAKVRRLEHLLHLKDIRIDDLATSLSQSMGLRYAVNGKR